MGRLKRLWLLFHTIRYLSPRQVRHRLWRMGRMLWRKTINIQAPRPFGPELAHYRSTYEGLSDLLLPGPWEKDISKSVDGAKQVSQLHFTFLQQSYAFHEKVLWEDPSLSQLWRYHLHYFEYVNDLFVWKGMGHGDQAYQAFRMLADSWINGNRRLMGDGWHPYTISLRIVNWLNAVPVFQSELTKNGRFYQGLVGSIYGQGRILAHDLEFDVRGNHLLKNLKALIWLGVAFKGSEAKAWLVRALALLELELSEQVLADGGHFERAPGYHLIVLRDCLEICLSLRRNQQKVPQFLEDALRSMLDYLVKLLPPDGRAPLIKDTAWDTGPLPWDLLTAGALYLDDPGYKFSDHFALYPLMLYGKSGWSIFKGWALNQAPRESVALPNSGYYIMRDRESGDHLIFDAGKPCPNYLPAHAHADMLSYELMVDGQGVVVDSGVYEYAAGPWRDFFRSTRAHSTVEVADADQSEVWGSFRVARRARPGRVVWEAQENCVRVQGEHDGYRRLSTPVFHRRTILWQKQGFWLIVDELVGKGTTQCKSRIHFHPDLTLTPYKNSTWKVKGRSDAIWVSLFGEDECSTAVGQTEPVREGWYSERFGELVPNTALILGRGGKLPFFCGYVISKQEKAQVSLQVSSKNQFQIDVKFLGQHHRFEPGPAERRWN
ncbi:MAG: alginate lyase family protein [Pseudomonadota bacterium]